MDGKERIQFAVEFAECDLERVFRRPERLEKFKRQFKEFLFGIPGAIENLVERAGIWIQCGTMYEDWTISEYNDLRRECRMMLRSLAIPTGHYASSRIKGQYCILHGVSDGSTHFMLHTMDAKEAFLIMLWHLLYLPVSQGIACCPEESCGHKLFIKPTKRAVYCSRTCATRARVRRMRAGRHDQKPVGKVEENYSRQVVKGSEKVKLNKLPKRHQNPRG